MKKSICIVDMHPLFRETLRSHLERAYGDHEIVVLDDPRQLIHHLEQNDTGLLIYDILASQVLPLTTLSYISGRHAGCRIIATTNTDIVTGHAICRKIGLSAVISKTRPAEAIMRAIDSALHDTRPARLVRGDEADTRCYWQTLSEISKLSPRKFRILTLLAEGKLNKEIAWEVNASEASVKSSVTRFFRMLNLKTRTEVAVFMAGFERDTYLNLGTPLQMLPGQHVASRERRPMTHPALPPALPRRDECLIEEAV